MAFRKPPLDPALVEMFDNMNDQLATNKIALQDGLEANQGFIRTTKTDLLERMEDQKRVNEKSFETLGASLQSINNETLDALEKGFQEVSRELLSAIEMSVSGVRGEVLRALAKQEEVIRRVGRSSKKSIRTIEKVTADLDGMKTMLETLETALALPQPKLTSHSGPRDVKGIGPRLAEELKSMGITNIGEFLSADPAVIDKKTRLTRETAERLQGAVQLLMVPGIDKTDVELLEKVGVANRKELGKRDPFELYRKLSEVVKTYVEERKISEAHNPTVEDVLSWVKLAKS